MGNRSRLYASFDRRRPSKTPAWIKWEKDQGCTYVDVDDDVDVDVHVAVDADLGGDGYVGFGVDVGPSVSGAYAGWRYR